ncbi:hypothetical protein B9Q02_08370 [Candidatus Marsarchaeota G1 archaeon BE_D]|jgi:ABC-type branched-chain amino acid transport systems, ATPase component|uniref:ABC transporter domain-containing protein n=1 Tax=Candidatus Marsarchaeota G1 archaeon BE_D TaxID=1978156 RepID=A0A2R6AEU8_9ARCH|nr:MAG: hypothetical protein B9Q02_08370 [Candidatus Marsarchaeota G1 archaeon BE_D]
MLETIDLKSGYEHAEVLHGINLKVIEKECTVLLGPNGAGKSTLLKTIFGILKPISGRVSFRGKEINGAKPKEVVRLGISYVPQGAEVFHNMTVEENLKLGGYALDDKLALNKNLERVYELFPRLKERRNQKAGFLSGGERQMLAIARGLMTQPSLLMLDEPSIGLDIGKQNIVIETLKKLKEAGITILLVEQNTKIVSDVCDKVYIINGGRIKYEGEKEILFQREKLATLFFGEIVT